MVHLVGKVAGAVIREVRDHFNDKVKRREWLIRRCEDCGNGFAENENIYMTGMGDMHRECWYARGSRGIANRAHA
jgi:hypothetical protein